MNIHFTQSEALNLDVDVAVVAVGKALHGLQQYADALGADLEAVAKTNQFDGAAGTSMKIATLGRCKAPQLVIVGTGKGSDEDLRLASGAAGRALRALGATSGAVSLGQCNERIVEFIAAGNYVFDQFKPEKSRRSALTELHLTSDTSFDTSAALVRAKWQSLNRDLVNLPAADLYPQSLADWAVEHLGSLDNVEVEIWDYERLHQEGCVGIIAVGQGSSQKPRLIKVSYRPANAKDHIALVGKGVTFDAGGLSIKGTPYMQTMRCDMGGSAAVLAAIGAAAELGLPIAIDTWVGAAENMLGAEAFKLGDILRYKNGVTVEIHNTDAEGRLVLADCLIRACEVEGVSTLIDAATLTGAVVVALGEDYTGLFTADDALADDLAAASDKAGERIWRLPLHNRYNAMLKSDWAQIKNVGGRSAGSTTAALFLQHFVDGPRWAHLDIAGSTFHDKAGTEYASGATGEPVRTLVYWMESLA